MKTFQALVLASSMVAVGAAEPELQARAVAAFATRWTRIHLPGADYLQMEVSELPGGIEPVVDSLRLEPSPSGTTRTNVRVHWKTVAIAEPEGSNIRRVRILNSVPGMNLMLDTIFSCRSGQCQPVVDFGAVDNNPRQVCTLRACAELDSASSREQLQAALRTSSWVGILDARMIKPQPTSWWTIADGSDSFPEVVLKSPSNAGDWVERGMVQLGSVRRIKGNLGVDTVVVPTGAITYVYNRKENPLSKIGIQPFARIFQDSILKSGPELWVSGSIQRSCIRMAIDTLIDDNAWLVAASNPSEIPDALAYNTNCRRRDRAWKVSGDTVWLNTKATISIAQILGAAGVDRLNGAKKAPLARHRGGRKLEFTEACEVRILAPDGRILSRSNFGVGRHELGTGLGLHANLIQVRSLSTGAIEVLPLLE